MKIYITKYALTNLILEVEAKSCSDIDEKMIRYALPGRFPQYAHGKEWQKTKADAILRCEEMRNSKIKSLKKQIAKVESLDFEAMIKKAGE